MRNNFADKDFPGKLVVSNYTLSCFSLSALAFFAIDEHLLESEENERDSKPADLLASEEAATGTACSGRLFAALAASNLRKKADFGFATEVENIA